MKIKLLSLITLLLILSTTYAKTSGEELFKPCKACHNLTEDRLVGPGLAGVTEKRDRAWLKSWITSSTKLIASGDADAKAIFDEFKIPMQDYNFSDEDMETLIDFLGGKVAEEKVAEVVEKKAVTKETTKVSEKTTTEKDIEKKEESEFKKALKNRPLTRRLFELSLLLLFGVLIAAITIYRKSKKL